MHALESARPSSLVAGVWSLAIVLTLWQGDELRDWLLEDDRAPWAAEAADALVGLADQAGVSLLREQAESLRARLYGRPADPPPLAASSAQLALGSTAGHTTMFTTANVSVISGASSSPKLASTILEAAAKPKRVLLVGASSMQFAIGQALEAQLAAYEGLSIRRFGKASTGLARPEEFNWPARLDELLAAHRPELVIVNFGGNDAQNIPLPRKQRAVFGTAAWDEVYGERVADFVTRIRARGAQAVMLGMPIMRSPKFSERMLRLNEVTQQATRRAGGIYLDQWDLAATPDGQYRERVEEAGRSRPMRLGDGIHYTDAGGRYVVARLLVRLERQVHLTPKDATIGVVERHSFKSAALGRPASYLAWLPRVHANERVPLLVLLHGADSSPDDLSEHLHAVLARAAEAHRVTIVAPDGSADGWWLDSPERPGSRYASLVAADLLADVRAELPVNEVHGIMGISMGGHGALTLALDHPGVFRSVSSLSGVVDLTLAHDRPALVELLGALDSRRDRWESHSARQRIEAAPERARGLALRLSCGTTDRWFEPNRALHQRLDALQIAHAYDEAPAGHDWSYWTSSVPSHVAWHAKLLNR